MKKIFILTGEPSGDRLASTVISKLKKNHSNIKYFKCWRFSFKFNWNQIYI